ncbi:MAG: site-specific integrase [Ruminococcaceae bacterium]|nr:site-specific integrase [Oscillospiraceae bacterium]
MQGSIRKKGATWSYRVEFGASGGKRNQIERSGYKTKKEAAKALNDVLYLYNNTGDYVENKKITFTEVYTEFIENEAPATRAYATIVRYKSLYKNHYAERFGSFYMYQINANMISDFLNEKRTYLSEEFVKGLYKFLKVLFGYAHKRQYIKKDIFREITPPPDPRHKGEIRAYTPDELRAMEQRLQGSNVIVPFYIALNTGLRESEVFGLQWSDIDFENRKIKVHKQLLFQDKKWCFCPLKTTNAYRSVNITDSFCTYLKNLKAKQEENKAFYGDGYKRNFVTERLVRNKEKLMEITDFVNVKINGEMLTTNSIKFMSRTLKADLDIPFKFHNLRHTYATVLAESGISPRYVQETLGHSKLEFTLRYYTHITEKMGGMARKALESAVSFAAFNNEEDENEKTICE